MVHNFQKHLIICLRLCIKIQVDTSDPVNKAAMELWEGFKKSPCLKKKILHYVLGDKNEYEVTAAGLKETSLKEVYAHFDHETLRKARIVLAEQVQEQLTADLVERYLVNRRLRLKARFKKYAHLLVE